jgi:hypothetical protein
LEKEPKCCRFTSTMRNNDWKMNQNQYLIHKQGKIVNMNTEILTKDKVKIFKKK